MLKWIKGSNSGYPLADEGSARKLIAALPPFDPYKSLEEVCYWLDTLGSAEDIKLPRVLEIIDLIDLAAKNHQHKLSQDYLGGSARLLKFQEIRIWNTIFSFWRQLSDTYQMCLTRIEADANGRGALKGQRPMVVARALRALALQLKWQLLRYGPVEQRVWEQMGRLYAYAEEREFAATPVVVYPGTLGESTVQREFLKGVMLTISSTDSLLPVKLEIAERIVAQFSQFFAMNRQPATGCHYYFDLSTGKVPARMMSHLHMTPGLRFFGPGGAAGELQKLVATVQAKGAVPPGIDLGGTFEPEVVLETLRHLSRYWAPMPPARTEERRACVSRISVIHDFDEIVSTVSGESQELLFDSSVEAWTVENESEGGYGALMPETGSDWLRVGSLLGIRLAEGAAWGVGVVRRLSAYDHRQRYVGIQVLTKGATVVKLAPISAMAVPELESALLLPSTASNTKGVTEMNLLLKPGAFSLRKSMEMHAYEHRYLLVPHKLIEGGRDFDMARFRLLQPAP